MAFPIGHQYRMAIIIDHTKIDADLTDWTLVFDQAFNAVLTQANGPLDADGTCPSLNGGGDVRFSADAAGATRLACDIRNWVTDNTPANAKCEAAVKVPSVSSAVDTIIYMWWYKAGETQPAVSDTYGQYNAYDSNYVAVWHQGGGTTQRKSASFTGTAVNGVTEGGVTGKVGMATQYTRASVQYFSISGVPIGSCRAHSIEALTKAIFPAATSQGMNIYDERNSSDDNAVPGTIYFWADATPAQDARAVVRDNADVVDHVEDTTPADNTWYHFAETFNGSNSLKIYRDGSLKDTDSTNTIGTISGIDAVYVGANAFSPLTWSYDGIIDELRISLAERSAAWLKADYNNQFNTANFLTFGDIMLINPLYQGAANPGVYGNMYISEGTTVKSVPTGAATLVTSFASDGANGVANGVVPDKANNKLTLTYAGVYRVMFNNSILGGNGGIKWEFEAHDINGKIPGLCGHCETLTNKIAYTDFANIYTAAAGTVLKMYAKHNQGGSENVTLVDTQFTAKRLSS